MSSAQGGDDARGARAGEIERALLIEHGEGELCRIDFRRMGHGRHHGAFEQRDALAERGRFLARQAPECRELFG
ncbi:hypothetical protein [Elioraea sp.]|uniref:hypothetical protein n=1 Tax=Elioraea sp. TaxID=2185103 RepID=UPI003F6E6C88